MPGDTAQQLLGAKSELPSQQKKRGPQKEERRQRKEDGAVLEGQGEGGALSILHAPRTTSGRRPPFPLRGALPAHRLVLGDAGQAVELEHLPTDAEGAGEEALKL